MEWPVISNRTCLIHESHENVEESVRLHKAGGGIARLNQVFVVLYELLHNRGALVLASVLVQETNALNARGQLTFFNLHATECFRLCLATTNLRRDRLKVS